jgi:hypothetical protein
MNFDLRSFYLTPPESDSLLRISRGSQSQFKKEVNRWLLEKEINGGKIHW